MPLRQTAQEREQWLARESNREEWRRLWAAAELADDFRFLSVHLGDPQASTFVAQLLAEHVHDSPLHLCTFELGPETRVSTLLERLREAPRPRVFWLVSDANGPKLERLFLLLNQKREVVSSLCEGPLLLGLHPLAWASFRRCAPDFWSVHQAVFRFSPGHEVSLERPIRRPQIHPHRREDSSESHPTAGHWRLRDDDLQAQHGEFFVGRESESSLLSSVLREYGTKVLITGPAGIGKTALVREVLPRVAKRYPDGVWFIPLDPRAPSAAPYAAAILERLLTELRPGVPTPSGPSALRQHFVSTSRASRALFVFEDLEDPELVPLLLPGAGSSAIVTSRLDLDLAPFDHVVALGGLSMHAATQLLSRVHQASEAELRRAAALTRGVPFDLRRVSMSSRPGADGESALETWSDDARALWAKLGLFAGAFRAEDAVAISGWDPARVNGSLEELLALALIDRMSTNLYRCHERQRDHAARLLSEQPDHERVRRAFARYVLVDRPAPPEDLDFRAAEAWLRSHLQDSDLSDEDWAILRAAALRHTSWSRGLESLMELAHTVAQNRGDPELLAAIYRFNASRAAKSGERDEERAWRERELDMLLEADGELQAAVVRALLALAESSDREAARDFAERAARISDELGNLELRVRARLVQAESAVETDAKRGLLEQALELAAQATPRLQITVYRALADLERESGVLDGARAWLERAIELDDDPALHYMIGELSEQAGDLERSVEGYRRAMQGFDENHDEARQANTLARMGQVSIARGDLETAQRWHEQALAIDERLEQSEFSLVALAQIDRLRGRLREAVSKLIQAYEGFRMTEPSVVLDEVEACYDEAETASARAEIREQWVRAGLDWDVVTPSN